ncbi:MAG: hypothetical protein PHX16_07700 [Syntrophaceticus sp.]|jgi:hypothetical protein|nr:hypothetical protein [Eubacteriales bacterium]MDD4360086.1 hypothetical protein [Syntrophaceticus sp.]MDD4783494.1 hypothetical protein [Syntrophaceticus sp.]
MERKFLDKKPEHENISRNERKFTRIFMLVIDAITGTVPLMVPLMGF